MDMGHQSKDSLKKRGIERIEDEDIQLEAPYIDGASKTHAFVRVLSCGGVAFKRPITNN